MKIHVLAAIDIGSNAVRLLINTIYEYANTSVFNKTQLVRVPIRLGADVFTHGIITEANIHRLTDAMQAYKLLMELYKVEQFRSFATSAFRESANSQEVVQAVESATGISIEVIDGNVEAEVLLKPFFEEMNDPRTHYLFVDVGGGSTEISLMKEGEVLATRSFKIGTVRYLSTLDRDNILEGEIRPFVTQICKGKRVELVGSGGNINFLAKFSRSKEEAVILYSQIKPFFNDIKKLSYEERIAKYNMKTDRADVIVPALKIYTSVMKWSKANKIHIPKYGLADGIIRMMYEERKVIQP